MIRQRFSKFLSYSGCSKAIKRTILTTLASSLSTLTSHSTIQTKSNYDYDLAVIGGGSGGLATAFEANKHGLKVIVVDFVEETSHKSKWGLGGTCVNVGCIPKKLMHESSKLGEQLVNSSQYGWQLPDSLNDRSKEEELKKYFKWGKLRSKIQGYIKSINFGYIASINRSDGLEYLNSMATFKDEHTVVCSKDPLLIKNFVKTGELPKNNEQTPLYQQIRARNFVIATGTRPSYLNFEGSHHAITSDDIFMKKTPPGKTLVIGGGYVAVQIAGFLKGMGYPVSLATRGEYLRSFDRDMVAYILEDLKKRKVNIIPTSLPVKIQKNENGTLKVTMKNVQNHAVQPSEDYDTVLFAVGRTATTDNLNVKRLGLHTAQNKKIKTLKEQVQRTNIGHIYAIGDVVEGLPELTSTATKMGWSLGKRIAQRQGMGNFKPHELSLSLQNYPTTIFTPLQYSCSGLNQQQAIAKFGRDDVSVYHTKATPLQQSILQKYDETGESLKTDIYAKAVVQKSTDKVLGLHYAGPNAGEVMQGYAVAMKIGLTKEQLDSTIGIHPTCAEQLTSMDVTKESGQPYQKTSC